VRAFIAALLAVLSAFIGIRKRSAATEDQQIKPIHIVVVALLCVVLLVSLLIVLVRFIISAAAHG
jgi:Protein of unknown function (DUF2970)